MSTKVLKILKYSEKLKNTCTSLVESVRCLGDLSKKKKIMDRVSISDSLMK